MKAIYNLSEDISKWGNKAIENLIKAQHDTAKTIHNDVLDLAPSRHGKYADSIKVSDTEFKDGVITTDIYTDLKSEDGYFVGRMIENGTGIYALEPHIGHTGTFLRSQFQYWYVPVTSVDRPIGKKITIDGQEFYVARPQPARPHFYPALQKNVSTYQNNIRQALEEDQK